MGGDIALACSPQRDVAAPACCCRVCVNAHGATRCTAHVKNNLVHPPRSCTSTRTPSPHSDSVECVSTICGLGQGEGRAVCGVRAQHRCQRTSLLPRTTTAAQGMPAVHSTACAAARLLQQQPAPLPSVAAASPPTRPLTPPPTYPPVSPNRTSPPASHTRPTASPSACQRLPACGRGALPPALARLEAAHR